MRRCSSSLHGRKRQIPARAPRKFGRQARDGLLEIDVRAVAAQQFHQMLSQSRVVTSSECLRLLHLRAIENALDFTIGLMRTETRRVHHAQPLDTVRGQSGEVRLLRSVWRTNRPPLLKAFAAVNRASLCWLKGDRSLLAALRTGRFRFGSLEIVALARGLRALCFAAFTPLGLILEALVGIKQLLARGENKFCSAFRALQNLILVLHVPLHGPALVARPPACSMEPDSSWTNNAQPMKLIPSGSHQVALESPRVFEA